MNALPAVHPENYENLVQVHKENLQNMKYYYVFDSEHNRRIVGRTGADIEPAVDAHFVFSLYGRQQPGGAWQIFPGAFGEMIPFASVDEGFLFYKYPAAAAPNGRRVLQPRDGRRRTTRRHRTRRNGRSRH